ncbi:phage tail protein [Testudinibacter sp. P27/CKL/0425]
MIQQSAMMALGLFVFTQQTVPFQDLQRQLNWRHPTNAVVGRLPKTQFVGKESETVTINGVLMPSLTGGRLSLGMLELMADSGKSFPLIGGNFEFFGIFVIESISETRSFLFADGAARRIEFSMTLKRTNDTTLLEYSDQLLEMI